MMREEHASVQGEYSDPCNVFGDAQTVAHKFTVLKKCSRKPVEDSQRLAIASIAIE